MTPSGGLANCQDFFCGDIYASICHTFVYNRKDDACYIFDRDAVSPVCKIHSGVPEDEHEDCDNSAIGCDVSLFKITLPMKLFLFTILLYYIAFH